MPAPTISNHFAITALQEGITVQGSLRIDGTLSQNWNNNTQKAITAWVADFKKKGCKTYLEFARMVNTHNSVMALWNK